MNRCFYHKTASAGYVVNITQTFLTDYTSITITERARLGDYFAKCVTPD